MSNWPPTEAVVDELLAIAKSYTLSLDRLNHPEDIAYALTTAIEVAWRAIKPEADA